MEKIILTLQMAQKIDYLSKRISLLASIIKSIKALMIEHKIQVLDLIADVNGNSKNYGGYIIREKKGIERVSISQLKLENNVLYYKTGIDKSQENDWSNLEQDVVLDNLDTLYDAVYNKVTDIIVAAQKQTTESSDETWKAIDGYEGKYEISNMGRVRSFIGNNIRILKARHHHRSSYVSLQKDGKEATLTIGREVAKWFVENPNGWKHIIHIDGDFTNNKASNLKWIEKANRKQPLTPVVQLTIDGKPIKVYASTSEASRIMECSEESIIACCKDQTLTVGGCKWLFKSDFDKLNK